MLSVSRNPEVLPIMPAFLLKAIRVQLAKLGKKHVGCPLRSEATLSTLFDKEWLLIQKGGITSRSCLESQATHLRLNLVKASLMLCR